MKEDKIINIYDTLFSPINKRRIGYWKKPLNTAKELVQFARTNKGDDFKTIEVYSDIDENTHLDIIFLDFDLTNKQYLKQEGSYLEETLKELTSMSEDGLKAKYTDKKGRLLATYKRIAKVVDKFNKFNEDNDGNFIATSFVAKLTEEEATAIRTEVEVLEAKELASMSDNEIAKYYYDKIEQGYLKEPFKEATAIANYFEERSVKCVLNWSGRHGLHLRIPILKHYFEEDKLNEDITLFLTSLANLLEIHVLNNTKVTTSTLDYNVIRPKGLQRLPCSKHNKSKLYSNFIPSELWTMDKYIEAVDYLEISHLEYIPSDIDKEVNSKMLFDLPIVKEAIATAIPKTAKDNYKHEGANPNYKFTSDNSELLEQISKVYVQGQRNVIGYRFVHLLRRSGYAKEDVEAIFRELHTSEDDFKETIQGSINSAYSKDISKLGGLKHLVEGIEEVANDEDREDIINYFKTNFSYYDKPTEEKLDSLHLEDKEVEVVLKENRTTKWLVFKDIANNIDLHIDLTSRVASFINADTNKTISFFKFNFSNKIFEVKKKELSTAVKMLKLEDDSIKLDDLFIQRITMYLKDLPSEATSNKEVDEIDELKFLFDKRKNIDLARRNLGHYLRSEGMILRKTINTPYLLDKASNGYKAVSVDDIIHDLNNVFEEDSINNRDVEEALTFIGDRRTPKHNIVQFSNCLYSMDNFEVISKDKEAEFTLTQTSYKYNPNALADIEDKPLSDIENEEKLVRYFLYTSLRRQDDNEEQVEARVKAFLQMIGYLFVSGNQKSAFFIITGIGGGGKSLATNIITKIFGSEKVGGLSLQQMTPNNKHSSSSFLNKKLNIVRDSSKEEVKDIALLKQATGYEDVMVEPKGKDHIIIPKEEVPHMILTCNEIPKFKEGATDEVVERFVIFEFPNKFRQESNVREHLYEDIIANDEEIEWLIYNGIEAYKEMVLSKKDFSARKSIEQTRMLLNRNTDSISYILPLLIKEYNPSSVYDEEEPIFTNELNDLIRYVAKKEGLSMSDLDNEGKIKAKVLINKIRDVFDLHETTLIGNDEKKWTTQTTDNPRTNRREKYYPYLVKTDSYTTLFKEMEKDKEANN